MGTLNIAGIDFDVAQPKTGGSGDRFDKGQHEGDMVVFVEPEARDIDSQYGTATAAACDFVIALKDGEATVYEDVLIFGAALAPAVYNGGSRIVAGRLTRANKAKAGRSRAWLLEPLDDADAAFVQEWASENLTVTNGRIAVAA